MKSLTIVALLLITTAFAQIDSGRSRAKGYVTTDVAPTVSLNPGNTAQVEVRFRVNPGYHVNSHTPGSDLLIPTNLEFTPLDKIKAGKIAYPTGEPLTLDFSKEKISVYTGDFTTEVPVVVAKDATVGSYSLKGELQYQACNNNSCFPPKSLPVEITVIVKK